MKQLIETASNFSFFLNSFFSIFDLQEILQIIFLFHEALHSHATNMFIFFLINIISRLSIHVWYKIIKKLCIT